MSDVNQPVVYDILFGKGRYIHKVDSSHRIGEGKYIYGKLYQFIFSLVFNDSGDILFRYSSFGSFLLQFGYFKLSERIVFRLYQIFSDCYVVHGAYVYEPAFYCISGQAMLSKPSLIFF